MGAEKSPIGRIKTGQGEVVVVRSGQEIAVHTGDRLYPGDRPKITDSPEELRTLD